MEVFTRILGEKEYEMKDHLGNVRVVISDVKLNGDADQGGQGGQAGQAPYMVDMRAYNNYYPFGMLQPERSWSTEKYRYGFNGKEMDNEMRENPTTGTSGTGNHYDYGFRVYDPRSTRFLSVDPLTPDYPAWTPYAFAMNRVIDGVDLDGLEYFYAADGRFLGRTGTSTTVHVVMNSDVTNEIAIQGIKDYNAGKIADDVWENKINTDTRSLGATIDQFTAFASMIDHESGGNRLESFSIGTASINFLNNGGSRQLKTLDDITLYDNWFAQGATQAHLNKFAVSSNQNRKFAVESAINGLMYQQGIGGVDYSNGADSWDGIDLVLSKNSKGRPIYNSHRKYIWSTSSKSILNNYSNKFGDVNTNNWKFEDKDFQVKTTSQHGGTIFTDIQTGRGEGKQSQEKFTVPQR